MKKRMFVHHWIGIFGVPVERLDEALVEIFVMHPSSTRGAFVNVIVIEGSLVALSNSH